MAVKTRKFNSTIVDANGNLHANGVGMPSISPVSVTAVPNADLEVPTEKSLKIVNGIREARDAFQNQQNNIVNSMTPNAGTVQVGVAPGTDNTNVISGPLSQSTKIKTSGSAGYEYDPFSFDPFSISKETKNYKNTLHDLEASKPDPFQSRYESQIQTILDGILNRKSFDLNNDQNYQTLYDQYAQSYMQKGNKAMRDTMGNAAALTGGYGSTAAQIAGSQAYDNYLQGLNDQNLQLMNLAYQMYGDETADRYNQLGAVTGLDNTDYARYRDTVGDYYNDLNYYANRYDTGYNRDYTKWANDRDFNYDAWNNDRNFDYNTFTGDRAFDNTVEQQEYAKYQDAVNLALKYAQQGLPVPAYIAQQITDYTGTGDINDVIAAMPVSAGGSGGGGGRGRGRGGSGGSSTGYKNLDNDLPYSTEVRKVADTLETKKGNSERYYVIAKAYADGIIDDEQMNTLLKDYGISERNALSDTNSAIGKKIQSVVTKSSMNQFEEDYKKKNNSTTLPTSLADIRKTFMY